MILRDIVERSPAAPSPPAPPQPPAPSTSAFPPALHRSQRPKTSAFSRARRDESTRSSGGQVLGEGRIVESVPPVGLDAGRSAGQSASRLSAPRDGVSESDYERIRREVDAENTAWVEGMTEEERVTEMQELQERFGPGLIELMRKRRAARQGAVSSTVQGGGPSTITNLRNDGVSYRSEADEVYAEVDEENRVRVEGMDVEERQVEIQELQERFGSAVLDALRKHGEARLQSRISTGASGSTLAVSASHEHANAQAGPSTLQEHIDDTSPSALKAKYFSSVPSEPEKLAWLQPAAPSSEDTSPRFDLSGALVSRSASAALPTHLGLHHHGDSPDLAGYTVQEVLHLCQSTVPSQRITMMGVLCKIFARQYVVKPDKDNGGVDDVARVLKEEQAREKAVGLALEVIMSSRSVGLLRAAIELQYTALGGPTWTWLDDMSSRVLPFRPDDLSSPITSFPFEDLLPRLDELLATRDFLPPISVQQVARILRRAATFSQDLADAVCPIVPNLIKTHVCQVSWPPHQGRSQGQAPSVEALRLLRDVVVSSRACAEAIAPAGILEPLLKFVVTVTWSADGVRSSNETGLELAMETLRLFLTLGRYGMSSNFATSAQDLWTRLSTYTSSLLARDRSRSEKELVEVYFDLLGVWTVCAIDPHRTTPEHDLTWAQISAKGWADDAIAVVGALMRRQEFGGELGSVLGMLGAWAVGLGVNGVAGGVEERQSLTKALRVAGLNEALKASTLDGEPGWDKVVYAAVRLHNLLSCGSESVLDSTLLESLIQQNLYNPAAAAPFRYELLQAASSATKIDPSIWTQNAFSIMTCFQPGTEPLALELLDQLLRSDWAAAFPSLQGLFAQLGHKDGVQLLRPLLQYAIQPGLEHLLAPELPIPTPVYLKVSTTLRPTGETSSFSESSFDPPVAPSVAGLPLSPDWVFSPLDELLRSADSEPLKQAPPDWTPSELEIVRATLLLAKARLLSDGTDTSTKHEPISRSSVILGAMKVFMLEHQTSTAGLSGSDVEVFRDPLVADLLHDLIEPLTRLPSPHPGSADPTPPAPASPTASKEAVTSAPLEIAARSFLGDLPFYQWYTDYLSLFSSISFGDSAFAQLILPPLSMAYPSDYRRSLWVDNATSLRLIRTPLSQVPLESPRGVLEFFEPREEDEQVLVAYATALARGWVSPRQEALYVIAGHHVAGYIWDGQGEKRKAVLGTLLAGQGEVVRQVLHQDAETPLEGRPVPGEEFNGGRNWYESYWARKVLLAALPPCHRPVIPVD
ncbi:hypothetical protein EHS25_000222 [Saitozyma podzolica]|uniref:RNA polymerase II-associated protein 1 C-terminal domain-containing protein n=1 Tax=Saitozyma podzolica TaxID=1890683 RepID=A0A427YVS4_9TREE|nr:hypothetical protein EHS25_000222 [Saitozyma podzolica]